jgi:hypothetical protein
MKKKTEFRVSLTKDIHKIALDALGYSRPEIEKRKSEISSATSKMPSADSTSSFKKRPMHTNKIGTHLKYCGMISARVGSGTFRAPPDFSNI